MSTQRESNNTNLSFLKDSLNTPCYATINESSNIAENQNNFYNDLMDSFEAQMLQDMKAEMESDSKTSSKAKTSTSTSHATNSNARSAMAPNHIANKKSVQNTVSTEQRTQSRTDSARLVDTKSHANEAPSLMKVNQKSPDVDYVEAMQREASGIQSPLSDDYNQTSEKYNFDAMTSSIEDTTTSLSKKTVKQCFFVVASFIS